MKSRDRVLLLSLGLILSAATGLAVREPGYMDADYYFATAQELAAGNGLREPFVWNYLDDPRGLPHPSHAYWMPLPTFAAALGIAVFGPGFSAGRLLSLLIAGALPMLAAEHAFRLSADRRLSWMSGLLALAPGYYAAYLVTTDSFAIYGALGGLLVLALASEQPAQGRWFGAGLLVGLCHLTRTDGILWIPLAAAGAWTGGPGRLRRSLQLAAGYGLVMVPWFWRNAHTFGSVFPPGQTRSLWMTAYNDLFLYPAGELTPARWLASGWGPIVEARLEALGSNLLSLWAINGLIFLLPLMVLGAWRFRESKAVRVTAGYLLLLLVIMSVVFPFAGPRGGYFHSSIAAMPVLFALVPPGLIAFLEWGRRSRGWDVGQGVIVLGVAAMLLAAGLTIFKVWERAIGPDPATQRWAQSARIYRRLAARIGEGSVAINNPPGFYLASKNASVVVPAGGTPALMEVAERFQVDWVILDQNRPPELAELFDDPVSMGSLTFAYLWDDPEGGRFAVYRVVQP